MSQPVLSVSLEGSFDYLQLIILPCRYFPTILIVLLAVFNDGAMIALSKDRVIASPVPNHWDLKSIFIVGKLPALLPSEGLPGRCVTGEVLVPVSNLHKHW